MSKQMMSIIGILLLAFGAGVCLGLFLGGGGSNADIAASAADKSSTGFTPGTEAQDEVHGNTLLSNRIRELETELANEKKDQGVSTADQIAFFTKYRKTIRLIPFDNNLKITPEMAEILGLSSQERTTVEQHLAEAKNEMDKLKDANTSVTKQTADNLVITVAIDPQGKTIENALNGEISDEIGNDRATFMMGYYEDIYTNEIFDPFSNFGTTGTDISVTKTPQTKGGYTVTMTRFGPPGSVNGWNSTTGGSVPREYQKYLPANFQQ